MLISLNWISDFVDLPADLDPHDLAERITLTTAEVEGAKPTRVNADGLIVARIESVSELAGTSNLRLVTLSVGGAKTVETVTTAPAIHVGSNVVYAPVGSRVGAVGKIAEANVAGKTSRGMILPGDAIGIALAANEAIFLSSDRQPGEELPAHLFDDWLIEIDNKSITNRPDLWGHYGVAREIAAMYSLPLKPYPVTPLDELTSDALPEIPISIDDPNACRRYGGIVLEGVPTQPAPLWMQLRLGHVGLRPITGLVDLTNYIMAELGQPMHAFDAAKVKRIEVAWAKDGERCRTLDGVERELTADELMIQCEGRSIALAGVMGGLETEVSEATGTLLLESANFDPATIRRTAARLGLRTDASARFEKSLDPAHTVLAIQRFISLARNMYPNLTLKSRLSDCYPNPCETITVTVRSDFVARMIGRQVPVEEAKRLLVPLGFEVEEQDDAWHVRVPSFRATNDISIEADIIEEITRYVGYGNIEPEMPRVSIRRFEPNVLHQLEQRTLEYFTTAQRFNEIQGYLWFDASWLDQLGVDPGTCVELKNPAAEGLHRLRRTLTPGLLAAVVKNRFHFTSLAIIEIGSVFEVDKKGDRESRHLGLVSARRGKKTEDALYTRLKGAIESWAWESLSRPVAFSQAVPDQARPWEHPHRTAEASINGIDVGRLSVIELTLRHAMDEHLSTWSIAWAELRLNALESVTPLTEPLGVVPEYPLVEMDFTFVAPASARYAQVARELAAFQHPLLKSIRFVTSYQGESIGSDRRSLTVRIALGDDTRTLVDAEAAAFRRDFQQYLARCGYEIR